MANITDLRLNGSRSFTNSTSGKHQVDDVTFQVLGGLSIAIMIVGIPGNILVIASVCLNKHLRTAANFLVMSLSVVDFLFLTTVVPVHAYTFLTGREPHPKVCWAVAFVTNWLLCSSVLSTGSIALNRFIVIVLKSKYRRISGNKAVVVTCIAVFLIPFLLLTPAFEGSAGDFGYGRIGRQCSWMEHGILKIILIACVTFFPMVIMTLCYIWIILYVAASRKKVGVIGETTTRNRNKEARLSLMLALVYIVYLLTTLPTLTLNIIANMGVPVTISASKITFVVVWISSAANPVVYGLVNKNYRNAYKNMVVRIKTITSWRNNTETVELNAE